MLQTQSLIPVQDVPEELQTSGMRKQLLKNQASQETQLKRVWEAASHGVEVEWVESDVTGWTPPARAFDLVCILYLQLPAPERRAALRHAVDALRPGGTLLVVGHDLLNMTEGWGGPTSPDVLFTPDDIAAEVGDLQVEKAERVRRPVEDGGALREAIDTLVRARRP